MFLVYVCCSLLAQLNYKYYVLIISWFCKIKVPSNNLVVYHMNTCKRTHSVMYMYMYIRQDYTSTHNKYRLVDIVKSD